MSRLLKVHHELYGVTNSPLLSRFIAPSKCCKPSPLHSWTNFPFLGVGGLVSLGPEDVEAHFKKMGLNLNPFFSYSRLLTQFRTCTKTDYRAVNRLNLIVGLTD